MKRGITSFFISKYLRKHLMSFIWVFLAIIGITVAILLFGKIINTLPLIINTSFTKWIVTAFEFVALFLLFVVSSWVRSFLMNNIAASVGGDIVSDLYKSVLMKKKFFFHHFSKPTIMTRVTEDVPAVSRFVSSTLSYSIRNFITFAGALFLLIEMAPKLILVMIAIIIVITLVLRPIIKKITVFRAILNHQDNRLISHLQEVIDLWPAVKIFQGEEVEMAIKDKMLSQSKKHARRFNIYRSLLVSAIISLSMIGLMLIVVLGAMEVQYGHMDIGTLMSFFFYTIIVATSVIALSDLGNEIQNLQNSLGRIYEIMDPNSNLNFAELGTIKTLPSYDIVFQNVSFSYPETPDFMVFKQLSFDIKEGEHVAVVGYSGAGKTTIIDLLLKFYSPNSGLITVGGQDLQDINVEFWYNKLSVAYQENSVFNRTVKDNILYGNKDEVEEKDLRRLVNTLSLGNLMNRTGSAVESNGVGAEGSDVSAGERQRIVNARSILRSNAQIFIYDESLSSLDYQNRKSAMMEIKKAAKGKTLIFITHYIVEFKKYFDRVINLSESSDESSL